MSAALNKGVLERRELEKILEPVERDSDLTEDVRDKLLSIFGRRYVKAERLLDENNVKEYKFTPGELRQPLVVGKGREYLVFPESGYCTCKGFYPSSAVDAVSVCYHLLGYKIAEAVGGIEEFETSLDDYAWMLKGNRPHRSED